MTYCTPEQRLKAKKVHQCTNCAEKIQVGETYVRWASFEDSCFTNKMHPECLEDLIESEGGGTFEYMPYSGERPSKRVAS